MRYQQIIFPACIVILLLILLEPILFTGPSANFSVTLLSGTAPLIVQFNDTSTGSPTAWNWSFSYASRNMFFYSQDFDKSDYWYLHKARLETADIPAPDGTWTAFKLIGDDKWAAPGGNDHFISNIHQPPHLNNTIYTASVYLKPAGRDWAMLCIYGSEYFTWKDSWFDIRNGTLGSKWNDPSILFTNITRAENGWYRCSVTYNSTSGNVTPILEIFDSMGNSTDSPNINFTSDNSSGIYVWGSQLELGYNATTYVRTYGGALETTFFSTSQNPTYSFNSQGNFSVTLNASNTYGFNITPSHYWINIS